MITNEQRERIETIMREHHARNETLDVAVDAVYREFRDIIRAADRRDAPDDIAGDNDTIDDIIGHMMHVLAYDL